MHVITGDYLCFFYAFWSVQSLESIAIVGFHLKVCRIMVAHNSSSSNCFKMTLSQPFIWVITEKIKSAWWTLVNTCTPPEHSMKIKQQAFRDVSSSRLTWQNMSAPSLIERTWLNGNNSHTIVSFESLIEDEEAHWMITPNFAYIYAFFLRWCKALLAISSNLIF